MNLIYRGCASKENFQLSILEELKMKGVFDHCTIISQTLDDGDCYSHKYYHEIRSEIGYNSKYELEFGAIPTAPKRIWEELLPYKDNALNMTGRVYNMHFMNYEEMNLLYIKNVEFWNWILDSDEIDMAFFTAIPHCLWEYVLYALCKVKGIPILLIDGHWVEGMCSVATNIENLGCNTIKYYNKKFPARLDQVGLDFYNEARKQITSISAKEKKKEYLIQERFIKECFYGSLFDDVKKILGCIWRRNRSKEMRRRRFEFYTKQFIMHVRQRINKRKCVGRAYFNKYASKKINLEDRYIVFFLQYEPEQTTLPKAGVFCCQLLSVKLLAEACEELNIKLYVKEHWSQNIRQKDFYLELKKIPNVFFVDSESPNLLLIDKAIMVASQTGTCILEAFLRGKPSIMLAYNAVSDAPGVHYVSSKEEVINAIKEADQEIKREEIERYFDAICKTSVRHFLDWPKKWVYSKEVYISDVVELIMDFVKQGMPKEYYYEREEE